MDPMSEEYLAEVSEGAKENWTIEDLTGDKSLWEKYN